MDPLTHALAGATVAWTLSGRDRGRRSLLMGALAGLAPDLDVLIRSSEDPLLAIEHHRGFTHSLLFALAGGTIAAAPFMRQRSNVTRCALAGIAAYTSHSLLDAATTYGTQLFWPFSRYRVGLDIISIIDPLFTLLLLIGVVAALFTRLRLVTATLLIAILWLGMGAVQRERATAAQLQLAAERAETRERGAVFPTFGNTIVWRSIYETGGSLRMDRIRVPWFAPPSYAPTASVEQATLSKEETAHQRIVSDFRRFHWFSDGWVARDSNDVTLIGDARYSLDSRRRGATTRTYKPVWGVRFDSQKTPPTEWVNRTRERRISIAALWHEVTGGVKGFARFAEFASNWAAVARSAATPQV